MQRFTISLDEKLAGDFDSWLDARGYANRSEAVRDLLRAELERTTLETSRSVHCVAALSYVFNHHERELTERLMGMQHAHHDLTVSTLHAHLDHEHRLETLILKGPTAEVQRLAGALCAQRGVHHGKLNLISVDLHAPHSHEAAGAPKNASEAATAPEPAMHFHAGPSH